MLSMGILQGDGSLDGQHFRDVLRNSMFAYCWKTDQISGEAMDLIISRHFSAPQMCNDRVVGGLYSIKCCIGKENRGLCDKT